MANLEDYVSWKRISDSDFYGNHSFFGPNGTADINPQDINQGYIGNCWIMAAISALAETPNRVDDIFISDALSPAGIYAV